MSGIINLDVFLKSIKPKLQEYECVFCTVVGDIKTYAALNPIATFREAEGLTLILEKSVALKAGLKFSGSFKQITLTVHSSLDAVGLTAAIASKLASEKIAANIVAAYYHDHIFIRSEEAGAALRALQALSTPSD